MTCRAFSWLSQKEGASIDSVSFCRCAVLPGTSKRPPELGQAAAQFIRAATQFGAHETSPRVENFHQSIDGLSVRPKTNIANGHDPEQPRFARLGASRRRRRSASLAAQKARRAVVSAGAFGLPLNGRDDNY